MFRPSGLYAALVTPFDADDEVDAGALRLLVRHCLDAGVEGLCPLGGTGEPLSLTMDEARLVIDTTVAAADGRPVLVGALRPVPAENVALARHAAAAGADAVMLIPPYFVQAKPRQAPDAVAAQAGAIDLPAVLFNSPGRAGLTLTADHVLALVERVPTLVGIKDATADMVLLTDLIRQAPDRFAVLQGLDELYMPSLALGADGAVLSGACLVPEELALIGAAIDADDLDQARALQLGLMPVFHAMYAEPNPGPLKHALAGIGIDCGSTRPPLPPVGAETAAALDAALAALATLD